MTSKSIKVVVHYLKEISELTEEQITKRDDELSHHTQNWKDKNEVVFQEDSNNLQNALDGLKDAIHGFEEFTR